MKNKPYKNTIPFKTFIRKSIDELRENNVNKEIQNANIAFNLVANISMCCYQTLIYVYINP
jgi:hypothetical protein